MTYSALLLLSLTCDISVSRYHNEWDLYGQMHGKFLALKHVTCWMSLYTAVLILSRTFGLGELLTLAVPPLNLLSAYE